MTKNRHSIRLPEYDYSSNGWYFVTICVQNKECLFGYVGADPRVCPKNPCVRPKNCINPKLNDIGMMIQQWIKKISYKFDDINLDETVIMPNHVHFIMMMENHMNSGQTHGSAPTIGTIIQWFKTMTTNEYFRGVKIHGWPMVNKRLWQRNYYEHIIRNEKELNNIREYIRNNPLMWEKDEENPDHHGIVGADPCVRP